MSNESEKPRGLPALETAPPAAQRTWVEALGPVVVRAPLANRFQLLPQDGDFITLAVGYWSGFVPRKEDTAMNYAAVHGAAVMSRELIQELVDELANDFGITAQSKDADSNAE